MRSKTRWTLAGFTALGAAALFDVALATADSSPSVATTLSDPVGDTLLNAPAFQDIVSARMTRLANGDFELLMEMAGPVPVAPPLPSPANQQIWWFWGFDLDLGASPRGYPVPPGSAIVPEFIVYVSWDGSAFAGTAIERRPLLSGGEAILTSVPFTVSGTSVEGVLDSTLIGEAPPSIGWHLRTMDWSGPIGSAGYHFADAADLDP
jgi:hypothetical protein